MRRPLAARLALALCLALGHPAGAAEPLRVGIPGDDYAPFSFADPAAPDGVDGFDLGLLRAFARERGFALELVRFRWPELGTALAAGRFELAAGGITIRPERSLVGRFSVPVATSGALVLVRASSPASALEDLDRPERSLAVNGGGHLEQVARARFPRARLLVLPQNAEVRRALLEGRADGAVTDTLEAPSWQRDAPALRRLGPFTRDRKAWLVRADRRALARDVDAWLLAREADGTLGRLRARWLGPDATATARPLDALLAAIDERMALMPAVAEAKRRSARVPRDPAREARVLAAGQAAVREAAARLRIRPPPEAEVRGLYRALIDGAVAIEEATLARPASPAPAADLELEIRPALGCIGERIAGLAVRLPPALEPAEVRAAAAEALRTPDLPDAGRDEIADAIAALSLAHPVSRRPSGSGVGAAP